MANKQKECQACKFYKKANEEYKYGECCLYPPRIIVQEGDRSPSLWPRVNDEDWCGQFKTKHVKAGGVF